MQLIKIGVKSIKYKKFTIPKLLFHYGFEIGIQFDESERLIRIGEELLDPGRCCIINKIVGHRTAIYIHDVFTGSQVKYFSFWGQNKKRRLKRQGIFLENGVQRCSCPQYSPAYRTAWFSHFPRVPAQKLPMYWAKPIPAN